MKKKTNKEYEKSRMSRRNKCKNVENGVTEQNDEKNLNKNKKNR